MPRSRVETPSRRTLLLLCPDLLQHLTTLVLDRKDGMITVDDGVRRLRLLDAKGKVWTQEMVLQVEEKSVILIDPETKVAFTCKHGEERGQNLSQHALSLFPQNELENFPIGTIQHCQAVMNSCAFDSLLALVCKESGQNKPDLHLFQCDDVKVC